MTVFTRLLLGASLLWFAPFVSAQSDLFIPPLVSGASPVLTMSDSSHAFLPGVASPTFGFNGPVLGPTLEWRRGDDLNIRVENRLPDTTTVHWHGFNLPAAADGGPHSIILPGEDWTPGFTVHEQAGTYWYHPHLHRRTNAHVQQGLAGMIIVRDDHEDTLDLPRRYGIDDLPLILQSKTFDASGQIVTEKNPFDSVFMVNATVDPVHEVPPQRIRLRLLNGASQRSFRLGFSDDRSFQIIASDGGLLNAPVDTTRVGIAPGERYEVVVDLSDLAGDSIVLRHYGTEMDSGYYGAAWAGVNDLLIIPGYTSNPRNGTDHDMLLLRVADVADQPAGPVPTVLNDLPAMDSSMRVRRRYFQLNGERPDAEHAIMGPFTINGQRFDMDRIDFEAAPDDWELWEIFNHTGLSHPFHLHNAQFRLIDRRGQLPARVDRGRKDVVNIESDETVKFMVRFERYTDDSIPYMYHCHMLTHEDEGMMGQFKVVDATVDTTGLRAMQQTRDAAMPNPVEAGETMRLRSGGTVARLDLIDLSGRRIASSRSANRLRVPAESAPGLYLLRWVAPDGSTGAAAVVVE